MKVWRLIDEGTDCEHWVWEGEPIEYELWYDDLKENPGWLVEVRQYNDYYHGWWDTIDHYNLLTTDLDDVGSAKAEVEQLFT